MVKSQYPENIQESDLKNLMKDDNILYMNNSNKRVSVNFKKLNEKFNKKLKEFKKEKRNYKKINKKFEKEGVRERSSLHPVMTMLSDLQRMNLRIENKLKDMRNNKGETKHNYSRYQIILINRRKTISINKRDKRL